MNILNNQSFSGKITSLLVNYFSSIMSGFEGRLFGNKAPAYPPIFIIGLPRSGTTLIYQTLCHCFQLAYTPMLTNYLIWMPSLSTWICRKKQLQYSSDFISHYGTSKGMASPGEGGMWNLWFIKDQYYDGVKDIGNKNAAEIKKFVGRFERILSAPFINKNLRNNNRIGVLSELFTHAFFIIVLRDPRDVALSLLKARLEMYSDENRFYSVQPRKYKPNRNISPEKSIVDQLNGLLLDMYQEMLRIGAERFVVIRYEKFCTSPESTMVRISDSFLKKGVILRNKNSPPEFFRKSRNKKDKSASKRIEAIHQIIENEIDWKTYNNLISLG